VRQTVGDRSGPTQTLLIQPLDDVELDDEGLGDAAFIEESDDSDVSEIISGDIETEKGA
jgi:hypothetical protein